MPNNALLGDTLQNYLIKLILIIFKELLLVLRMLYMYKKVLPSKKLSRLTIQPTKR